MSSSTRRSVSVSSSLKGRTVAGPDWHSAACRASAEVSVYGFNGEPLFGTQEATFKDDLVWCTEGWVHGEHGSDGSSVLSEGDFSFMVTCPASPSIPLAECQLLLQRALLSDHPSAVTSLQDKLVKRPPKSVVWGHLQCPVCWAPDHPTHVAGDENLHKRRLW